MFQTATLAHDPVASLARPSSGWGARLQAWRQALRPRAPVGRADAASSPAGAQAPAPAAGPASCDFWPLIERAAQTAASAAPGSAHRAAAQQALCALHGSPPGQPLVVRATESQLHALLAHLSAISRHVAGPQALPHATARIELGHAVLHWGESSRAEDGLQLARVFTRLSALPAAPTPADAALHHSVRAALRIVQACGGRLYPSASPLALMRLTVRLPLVDATPTHEVQA